MRTTVCTDSGARVIVSLASNGEKCALGISRSMDGLSVQLTPDQCGALIFGLEQAVAVMAARQAGAALVEG